MTVRTDEEGNSLPPLDSRFSQEEISMDLTRCGLLVEHAETIARLYARHRDWTIVKDRWLEERFDERSTRGSSQGIYRVLSSRFKAASGALPAISRLPSTFDQCETKRDKAQVLYFYLLEEDQLVKYVIHQYVHRVQESGAEGLDFEQDTVERLLNEFHYEDGGAFDYAESTTRRWGEGLRSVMREIGVLEDQQTFHGRPPNVGTVPLLVAAGYSWETQGEGWLSSPVGWLYLFQQSEYWESLIERVSEHDSWEASSLHGELRLEPVEETYAWADRMEGEK